MDFFSDTYFSVFGLNTDFTQISVFSPNTGKYRPEKTPYLDTFNAVIISIITFLKWIRNEKLKVIAIILH